MTKLRECPFCGGEAILNSGEDVECAECGIYMVHKSGEPTDAALTEEWNRRTPESEPEINDIDAAIAYASGLREGKKISSIHTPMTSVIEWTRYDGTPETLPEKFNWVLIPDDGGCGCLPAKFTHRRSLFSTPFPPGRFWQILWEGGWKWRSIDDGDRWAHFPTIPDA